MVFLGGGGAARVRLFDALECASVCRNAARRVAQRIDLSGSLWFSLVLSGLVATTSHSVLLSAWRGGRGGRGGRSGLFVPLFHCSMSQLCDALSGHAFSLDLRSPPTRRLLAPW